MTTEQKALALVNAERAKKGLVFSLLLCQVEHDPVFTALCRAIEAHEADKKAFSDVAVKVCDWVEVIGQKVGYHFTTQIEDALSTFILPEPEPDPLVEAMSEAMCGVPGEDYTQPANELRQALAARGYKIERIDND